MVANPSRSSKGFSSGATRAGALRRPGGPFVELRGAPGTQTRPRSCGYWFPHDPHGVSTPSGLSRGRTSRTGLRRTGAPLALSLPCKGPSQHPRTVPRTRRPAISDDASSRGLSCLTTHDGPADPHTAELPAPLRAASRVWLPPSRPHHRSSRTPCGAGASLGFTLQGFLPVAIGMPFGAPCPPGVRRVDSPRPHGERADVVACRASIPRRARSALPSPEGPGASMPSWVSSLQSTLSLRLSPPRWVRGGSPRTRWAV